MVRRIYPTRFGQIHLRSNEGKGVPLVLLHMSPRSATAERQSSEPAVDAARMAGPQSWISALPPPSHRAPPPDQP